MMEGLAVPAVEKTTGGGGGGERQEGVQVVWDKFSWETGEHVEEGAGYKS